MLVQLPFVSLFLLHYLPLSSAREQQTLGSNNERSGKKTNPFSKKIEELVKESLQEWHVPGVAIGVVDGEDMWSEGYGIATFPSTPITPSTLFYGASTTKAFTAAAMSLLIHSPNSSLPNSPPNSSLPNSPPLTWKTPISSLIPIDFVLGDDWATKHITIEDVLSHRTGMPRHDLSYGGMYEGRKPEPRDLVRALRWLPMTEEPRVRWQYCNMMYIVAGHVIETLTGGTLEKFLKEKIWGPLGMKSTDLPAALSRWASEHGSPSPKNSWNMQAATLRQCFTNSNHFAQGYVYNNDSFIPVPYEEDLYMNAAAGSTVSNVLDYSKWLYALLHQTSPIPKDAYKELFTPRMLHSSDDVPYTGPVSYALGWETSTYKGYQFFEHSGGVEAFGAHVIFFPELGFGACGFGNTGVTSNVVVLKAIWHLIDEKIGLKEEERFDWDAKFKRAFKQKEASYNSSTSTFYPSVPSPPLPPTLPLYSYTGTYFHPAYRNFTITLSTDNQTLHCSRQNVTWKVAMDFEHVSGDYFMAFLDSTTAPGLVFKEALAAEFAVASDGVVRRFGIALEPEMGREGRIWFERI